MGWLEEITLALKRVFDFEVSDSFVLVTPVSGTDPGFNEILVGAG